MTDTPSLFERLGGQSKLIAIIEDTYDRVLHDPDLASFFADVPMERLRKMQFHFLAAAFDGPVAYSGAELTAAHAGRGIGGKEFTAFCKHFADSLESHGVASNDVDNALGRLATFKDKVTGDANVDG